MIKKTLPESSFADDALMQEAALWLVKMSSDECTEDDLRAYENWKKEDPEREVRIEQLKLTLGHFSHLKQQKNSKPILSTLEIAIQETEKSLWLLRTVVFLISTTLISLISMVTWNILPTQEWLADTRNAYNQWQKQDLSDHSEIKISGETAYDIDFNQHHRVIQLYKGNILVEVAKDTFRPFMVETKQAKITALGTRFIVQEYDNTTLITMLESSAKVEISKDHHDLISQNVVIQAGQQLRINHDGILDRSNISPKLFETAWQHKMLMVQNMALPEVLGILNTYYHQEITFNHQELSNVKVTATLPLESSALALLAESLPIQVKEKAWGNFLVTKN